MSSPHDIPVVEGATRRLMIVDDDPPRSAWARLARQLGIEVLFVDRAQDALGTALRERPDAVILDLRLPDGDGRDVLAALKKAPETAGIPVVVFSGAIRPYEASICYQLGAAHVDEKPAPLGRVAERALAADGEFP